jgi:hypothetical protein
MRHVTGYGRLSSSHLIGKRLAIGKVTDKTRDQADWGMVNLENWWAFSET